jgi:hypothetical protein
VLPWGEFDRTPAEQLLCGRMAAEKWQGAGLAHAK